VKFLQWIKKHMVFVLTIALIVSVQCCFVTQKEGYHMDELLSFELSNAEYNPWIVPTQPVGRLAKFMHEEIDGATFGETLENLAGTVKDVLQNGRKSKLLSYKADVYEEPVWIGREQFQDYVTTDSGDRFNYFSVYFNVKDDNHPPVHFMLLHTMSSLFSEKVTVWMGCIINILTLTGCVMLFMKLGLLLDKKEITQAGFGKWCGITAGIMYGCSHAAIATTLLIRMYGVLTFFCVAFFYLHVQKWLEREFDKRNVMLIVVTVLGFLTQYFFLFYCLVLAAVTAMCLFVHKRKKEFFIYIRSMVIAAVLGVGVFPFSIGDVFASSRGVEALGNLTGGLEEYLVRLKTYGEILLERCFGNWLLGLLCVAASLALGIYLFLYKKEHRVLLACFYLPVLGYFLLAAKMSPMFVDRYLMAGFPFVSGWLALLICYLTRKLSKRKQMAVALAVFGYCCMHVFTYDGSYLYKGYEQQLQIAKEYKDLPCICIYEGSGYYDNLLEFAEYDSTLLVTPKELLGRTENDVKQLEEMILVVKHIVPQETLQQILYTYDWEVKQVLVEDGACLDDVLLCVRR